MTDYTKLVKALRCCTSSSPDDCDICAYQPFCKRNGTGRERIMIDASAAIEELKAEQKKTVTQIFGEEQAAWEGRCKDLMKQISELQAEVKRLEPKRGEWIESEEKEWEIYPFKKKTCSVCDCKIDHTFMLACMDYFDDRDTEFHYCPNCGAKMEVQDDK